MFDARTLTRLERVFDLQMWAFGCDTRHPQGNLFARRGMQRTPPRGPAQSSVWSDCVVALSSTGIHVTRGERSLRLQRGAMEPQLREQPVELLRELAKWILEWESWVDEVAGDEWRERSLSSRTRPAPWSAQELREQWSTLART